MLPLKNVPFSSNLNSKLIGNLIMLILNLLEYSQNYSMTSENLWNYYRAEIDDVNDDTLDGKSFKYKTKIVIKTLQRPKRLSQPYPD